MLILLSGSFKESKVGLVNKFTATTIEFLNHSEIRYLFAILYLIGNYVVRLYAKIYIVQLGEKYRL